MNATVIDAPESDSRGLLVSIFARWRNLQDRKTEIAEDSKELFAEAKGNGFEPKALRLAFAAALEADKPVSDTDKATQDLADVYLEALGTHPATRADVRVAAFGDGVVKGELTR